jgi:hypothetical protein
MTNDLWHHFLSETSCYLPSSSSLSFSFQYRLLGKEWFSHHFAFMRKSLFIFFFFFFVRIWDWLILTESKSGHERWANKSDLRSQTNSFWSLLRQNMFRWERESGAALTWMYGKGAARVWSSGVQVGSQGPPVLAASRILLLKYQILIQTVSVCQWELKTVYLNLHHIQQLYIGRPSLTFWD